MNSKVNKTRFNFSRFRTAVEQPVLIFFVPINHLTLCPWGVLHIYYIHMYMYITHIYLHRQKKGYEKQFLIIQKNDS